MKLFPIGTYLSAEKEDTIAEDSQTYAMILEKQANDENAVDENGKLITQEQSVTQQEMVKIPEAKVDISMDKLRDYEYLMSHFYTVDSSTMADANLINADRLLGKNMKLNSNSNEEAAGPKVLTIIHIPRSSLKILFRGCEYIDCRYGNVSDRSFESKVWNRDVSSHRCL